MDQKAIAKAALLIKKSKYTIAFSGAGISVESGIPPFRGEKGLWTKYDPNILDINTYLNRPHESWPAIKALFYDFLGKAKPNLAHIKLAELEKVGLMKEIITQNIDNLHQKAGSHFVHEFHGRLSHFICTKCSRYYVANDLLLTKQPPYCKLASCKALLKPDFVFFGEGISEHIYESSLLAVSKAKVMLIIGASGDVMPAASLPEIAKSKGCAIVEINPEISSFTRRITDVFIQSKASEGLKALAAILEL